MCPFYCFSRRAVKTVFTKIFAAPHLGLQNATKQQIGHLFVEILIQNKIVAPFELDKCEFTVN
jgi:hypothetical protein